MSAPTLLTYLTVGTLPAGDARLVAVLVAVVVAELVVAGAAELGAGGVVVVEVALDTHPVGDAGHGPHVVQGVPLRRRQDDAGVRGLLDLLVAFCNSTITIRERGIQGSKFSSGSTLR